MVIKNKWLLFWVITHNYVSDTSGLMFRFCWRPDWANQQEGFMADSRWEISGGIGKPNERRLFEWLPAQTNIDLLLSSRERYAHVLPAVDRFLERVVDSSAWTGRTTKKWSINLIWGFHFRGVK